jgi:hypothetical protein
VFVGICTTSTAIATAETREDVEHQFELCEQLDNFDLTKE